MKKRIGILTVLLLPLAAGMAFAGDAPLTLVSGPQRVALIELYTSEGCSSCPPADRWMSGLRNDPGLWRRFVPIALHVDYWDYIGWADPFASAKYSERQRRYAREGAARAVYTPGLFRNGREWRGWRAGDAVAAAVQPAGLLRVSIDAAAARVRYVAHDTDASDLTVHVAVLGMNLRTKVEAGENGGRVLAHDFVALALASAPLARGDDAFHASLPLPSARVDAHDRAIVAWVSSTNRQAPLQSVGGYLPSRSD